MTTPVPGWYRDPQDPSQARYWDGQAWSDQTQALEALGAQARVAESPEPLEAQPPASQPAGEASTSPRSGGRPPLLPIAVGLAALLVIGVSAAFLLTRGGDDSSGGEVIAGSTAEEESTAPEEESTTPEGEGTPPESTADGPGSISYEPYTPSDSAFAYEVVLPSGADWSQPQESEPTEGELLRVSVRGPGGLMVLVDRTPFEVPALTISFDSRETVAHPAFGQAERYVISQSELIPECRGSPCVDYLVDDRTGGGWGVLAGGGDDLALADTVAKRVANSLRLP